MSTFALRVLAILRRIPPGRVTTYGDVARMAGRPGAARAVGSIMRTAKQPGLPYHRVVAAGGRVGGYGGAPHLKPALLAAEGLVIRGRRIAHFERYRWPKSQTDLGCRFPRDPSGKRLPRRKPTPEVGL